MKLDRNLLIQIHLRVLNAVGGTVGGDTLLVAVAAGGNHPDAELADRGNVVLARVGTVLATTLLVAGLGHVGGSEGKAGESRKNDGGELHVDGWWLVFGEEVEC